jgi:hypothetical protein
MATTKDVHRLFLSQRMHLGDAQQSKDADIIDHRERFTLWCMDIGGEFQDSKCFSKMILIWRLHPR